MHHGAAPHLGETLHTWRGGVEEEEEEHDTDATQAERAGRLPTEQTAV
jgi:hypothetical protein